MQNQTKHFTTVTGKTLMSQPAEPLGFTIDSILPHAAGRTQYRVRLYPQQNRAADRIMPQTANGAARVSGLASTANGQPFALFCSVPPCGQTAKMLVGLRPNP